jgi:hypothetical protein
MCDKKLYGIAAGYDLMQGPRGQRPWRRPLQRLAPIARVFRRRATAWGAIAGTLAGALYAAQSAPHMVVSSTYDKLIVGAMLAITGAAIGWLGGCMLANGVSEQSEECSAAPGTARPGTERDA